MIATSTFDRSLFRRRAVRRMPGTFMLLAVPLVLSALGATAPAAAQDVAGGVYLFRYQPVDFEGADGRTEVYAAFLQVSHETGPWELFLEARGRDDRLRAFYPGNVSWAAYRVTAPDTPASLRLRAGKTYQTTGRFRDGSFLATSTTSTVSS